MSTSETNVWGNVLIKASTFGSDVDLAKQCLGLVHKIKKTNRWRGGRKRNDSPKGGENVQKM